MVDFCTICPEMRETLLDLQKEQQQELLHRMVSAAVLHTGLVFYKKVAALNYGGIKC